MDGLKTLVGLVSLAILWAIKMFKPDLLDAETATWLWATAIGLTGFGVIQKDTKRLMNGRK
jgi:hypothetical protein